jgi:uncharacterized membrane protein
VRDTLLIIHILSAAAWIGGSFMLAFAGPRMAKAGGPASGAWVGVVLEAVNRFFTPAAVFTLLSGIGLVLAVDPWGWSDAFVGIGIAAVVVALSIAHMNNVPSLRGIQQAAQAGDMDALAVNARKVMAGGATISLILILTEVAMVLRLGA